MRLCNDFRAYLKRQEGIATVLIAGLMLFLVLFIFVIAIDFAYIYTVRGEMKNAADAAALAAAGTITNVATPDLSAARQAAKAVASKNPAGGTPVTLIDNDIEFGFWNGTVFIANETGPINAVKVTARRTKERGNPVGLFFGQTAGWPTMDVQQVAIASRPPRPSTSLTLCTDACTLSTGTVNFYFKKQDACGSGNPPDYAPCLANTVAWTEFSSVKSTEFGPNSTIAKYIRGELLAPNVCGKQINTNNAGAEQIMGVLAAEFARQKTLTGLNYWEVLVPVFTNAACKQGAGYEPDSPFGVEQYATVRIYNVIGNPNPGITAQIIKCISCGSNELNQLLGKRPALVR